MADKTIATIVEEMSRGTSNRMEREAKKAQLTAQQEAQAEEDAYSRRNADIMLDARDARDRKFKAEHLGAMSLQQYINFCKQEWGFDPLV